MIGAHWIPLHRGNIGAQTDAEVMRQWGPPIVKIVWDGSTIPYLEDIPPAPRSSGATIRCLRSSTAG